MDDCLFGLFGIITKLAHISGLLFPAVKSYVLVLVKNGLGYIVGDFFANSSGQTGYEVKQEQAFALWLSEA
jgi:hypothetical protein